MKALIWDLDGVIADTAPYHFAAWRKFFLELAREKLALADLVVDSLEVVSLQVLDSLLP